MIVVNSSDRECPYKRLCVDKENESSRCKKDYENCSVYQRILDSDLMFDTCQLLEAII